MQREEMATESLVSVYFLFLFGVLAKIVSLACGRKESHAFVDAVLRLSSALLCSLCANKISGLYFLRSLH